MVGSLISLARCALPVVAGNEIRQQDGATLLVSTNQIYGTAFPIGGGFFLSAGHVLQAIADYRIKALGRVMESRQLETCVFQGSEMIADLDLAIIRADVRDAVPLPWLRGEAPLLTDVQAFGFPLAFDMERWAVNFRAFKGYVVGQSTASALPSAPRCYELSFACPKGISGAPVVTAGGPPHVLGVALATRGISVPVMTTTERVKDGASETIVEVRDTLFLGFALQADPVLPAWSALLGSTIGEHLARQGLLR